LQSEQVAVVNSLTEIDPAFAVIVALSAKDTLQIESVVEQLPVDASVGVKTVV